MTNKQPKTDKHYIVIFYLKQRFKWDLFHLVDMVQFRTRSSSIVGLFSEPLGAHFDPAATGLTAAWPVWPLTQFAVRWTGDDASLLNVPCNQSHNNRNASVQIHDPLQTRKKQNCQWNVSRAGNVLVVLWRCNIAFIWLFLSLVQKWDILNIYAIVWNCC